ncbi:hypothetical protein EB241_01320 [Erwinia psidii]|uniref:Uncharacterized protein n=1 Tax=Erwinia psidii TaxID=69224 RepID=A0A3N6UVJ7_9GAMM|nr:hypothetical protein EB241_01320 [Erwinia psidii]
MTDIFDKIFLSKVNDAHLRSLVFSFCLFGIEDGFFIKSGWVFNSAFLLKIYHQVIYGGFSIHRFSFLFQVFSLM